MVIVFDTFAWIDYFLDTENAKTIENYLENEDIITPSIVLLELSYKANKENWDLGKYLSFIKVKSRILGFNESFVLRFGEIYNNIKKQVKSMGFADCIILTTAMLNNAKILTGDPHFRNIENVIFLE